MRTRVGLLALAVAFGGIAVEAHALAAKDVTALLLTKRDVGASYTLNRGITQRWTLAERSEEMSAALRREFAAKWVAGAQTGFDGNAAVSHQAILSTADVFRTSKVASIRKALEASFIDLGSGTRLAIPRGAPGEARFLMRGRMVSNGTRLEVLLYQWQTGKTLQSVWTIGRPGVPRVPRLVALARLQAA